MWMNYAVYNAYVYIHIFAVIIIQYHVEGILYHTMHKFFFRIIFTNWNG